VPNDDDDDMYVQFSSVFFPVHISILALTSSHGLQS